MALPTMSPIMVPVSPQHSEPPMNRTSAATNRCFLPNRSPSLPYTGMVMVLVRK